jgi:hypothetical protein
MRPIKKIKDGQFQVILLHREEDRVVGLTEFSGEVGKEDSYAVTEKQVTDEESKSLSECFAGPNDPRLPDEVKNLPVGRREDYVEEFNFQYYFYWKDDDDEYDENKTRDENRVNYAFRKAQALLDGKKEKGVDESVQAPDVVRIRETYVGGVPFENFEEASSGGYSNEIVVIEEGWSANGHYWGSNPVSQVAQGCAEMVVGYFNHGETFNRDPRDWGIVTESGRMDGRKVKSNVHVFQYPDGQFLEERIEYARKHDANHLFGVSVDAFAQVEEGEAEGREGTIILNCVRLNSVDIVMIPAAKGRFNATQESVSEDIQGNVEDEEDAMDVTTLKEKHPDTATLLIEEGKKAAEGTFVEERQTLEGQVAVVQGELETTKDELAKAQAKVEAYEAAEREAKEATEKAERQATFEVEVKKLIEEELPEEKRTESFCELLVKQGPDKMDLIREMIAERKELNIAAPVVEGEGAGGDGVLEAEDDTTQEAEGSEFKDRLKAFKGNLK